tara:strand:- start:35453 stop:35638 length:186 start_codon:yes stop_codon:yes gene_type:complete
MKNIEIKTLGDSKMLINWANVNCVKELTNNFGESYREIVFSNGSTASTKSTVQEITKLLEL